MATWTNIPDGNLEPGDPIRSVDIIAIRDNPIAITEGASGAPKIQTAAITDANVTTAKLETSERMNTTNVLNAIAGATAGGVGTYMHATRATTQNNFNDTAAGSSLNPTSSVHNVGGGGFGGGSMASGSAQSGTWRCMGHLAQSTFGCATVYGATLWLRIS